MATGNKHSLGAGCIPEDLQSLSHLIAGSNPGHATDDPIIRPWRSECCEDADPGPWRFGITSTWWPRRRPGRRGARFGVRQHALEALLHGSEIGGAASVGIGRSPCCDPDLLMPFKANASRRHHILKQKRKVTNWAACDASLRQAVKLAHIALWTGDLDAAAFWRDYFSTAIGAICRSRRLSKTWGRTKSVAARVPGHPAFLRCARSSDSIDFRRTQRF
jgi:hypothetical protein